MISGHVDSTPSPNPSPKLARDMAENIEAIETDVRYFLLPTEEAKVAAECVVVHSPQLSDQETKPVFVEERIKRVLAVISHQGNAYQTHEQGWWIFSSRVPSSVSETHGFLSASSSSSSSRPMAQGVQIRRPNS